MKKLGFALMGLLMISSTGAFAQMSFGVKAGLNFSTMTNKTDGKKDKDDETRFKPGINVGAFADFELSNLLAVEAGMNVEAKGLKTKHEFKNEFTGSKETIKDKMSLYEAEILEDHHSYSLLRCQLHEDTCFSCFRFFYFFFLRHESSSSNSAFLFPD